MPFCQLPNDIPLHYITNTPRGDASDIDPDKPVLLLLPHNLTDVTWLREQFGDPHLSSRYNLIAIDLRNMGRSKAPCNPKQDAWVDGADVAVVHEVLQLPPCHVFSSGRRSGAAAMSFAVLFPEKCMSLFMCSFPMRQDDTPEWLIQDEQDLLELWCFPRDLEGFHLACIILIGYFLSNRGAIELQNELIGWWQKNFSPRQRSSVVYCSLRTINRPRFSNKELQAIRVPTFVVQGDKCLEKSPDYARLLSDNIPDSKFLAVHGAPDCLIIIPEYAAVVNRELSEFLGSQPPAPARKASPPDHEGVCRTALERLAALAGNPEIAQRDPTITLSFSRATREDVDAAAELLNRCSRGENDALESLDERGEPILKFSKKFKDRKDPAYFRRAAPMAAETEIVMVESCTVLETENQ